ncbi:hypothetical protein I215_03810 [Galbibacter marinus]|uniref:DinB-like domain-containing protein n=1 Tax=Galbibacter marinus TaxID=555500 RepID=K2PX33_9FLAO|nr:DinB family protein [Galbibacter marinus]EKF56039.1 hypothetical protein I215_03810 [Galbibacter marinus]
MYSTDLQQKDYPDYFNKYIVPLGSVNLIEGLNQSKDSFLIYMQTIEEQRYNYSYQQGKWSIAEVVQHLTDTERVFQYRAFHFARNPESELLGYDHELFAQNAKRSLNSKSSLLEQYESVRNSSVKLFESFSNEELLNRGILIGQYASVGALGFFILGHQKHHLDILKNRYL